MFSSALRHVSGLSKEQFNRNHCCKTFDKGESKQNRDNVTALTCATVVKTIQQKESNYNTRHRERRASEILNTRGGTERLRSEMKRTKREEECDNFKKAVKRFTHFSTKTMPAHYSPIRGTWTMYIFPCIPIYSPKSQ